MTTTRLTTKFVEKILPPKSGRVEHWDQLLPGFGLRVTEKGHKSWCAMYRHHGRKRRQTLGRFPAVSLEQARKAARAVMEAAANGEDPAEEARKRKEISPDTFQDLGVLFIERHARLNNRSWKNQQRRLEMHANPHLGKRAVDSIKKRDIVLMLEAIGNKAGPYVAEDTLKVVRKMFNWAADRDIVELNPAMHAKPLLKTKSRDRVLSDKEVHAVWVAAGKLGYPFGTFIRMLILTGQRRTEVATMQWSEIDNATWTMPAEKNKSAREHVVPLSSQAQEILSQCPKFDGPFVFTTTGGERSISGFNKPKAILDGKLQGLVTDWRFHDLRRTLATGLAKLGFPDEVIARVLNHAPKGVTSIYNRHTYLEEKRLALQDWSNRF